MSNKSTPPPMFKPFDSYVEDGKLIIVTTDYIGDEREVTLNTIRLERAKQIVKDLQEAIKSIEKSALELK